MTGSKYLFYVFFLCFISLHQILCKSLVSHQPCSTVRTTTSTINTQLNVVFLDSLLPKFTYFVSNEIVVWTYFFSTKYANPPSGHPPAPISARSFDSS